MPDCDPGIVFLLVISPVIPALAGMTSDMTTANDQTIPCLPPR
jgi:hypothetical protein